MRGLEASDDVAIRILAKRAESKARCGIGGFGARSQWIYTRELGNLESRAASWACLYLVFVTSVRYYASLEDG